MNTPHEVFHDPTDRRADGFHTQVTTQPLVPIHDPLMPAEPPSRHGQP